MFPRVTCDFFLLRIYVLLLLICRSSVFSLRMLYSSRENWVLHLSGAWEPAINLESFYVNFLVWVFSPVFFFFPFTMQVMWIRATSLNEFWSVAIILKTFPLLSGPPTEINEFTCRLLCKVAFFLVHPRVWPFGRTLALLGTGGIQCHPLTFHARCPSPVPPPAFRSWSVG